MPGGREDVRPPDRPHRPGGPHRHRRDAGGLGRHPRWQLIDKALGLGIPDPAETYSSSPHLFEELSIPAGATGTIKRPRVEKVASEPSEKTGTEQSENTDSERGEKPERTERPARTRTRRRTRGGRPADSVGPKSVSPEPTAPESAASSGDTDGEGASKPRRRRRRRTTKVGAAATNAE